MASSCCKTSYNNLLDKPFYETGWCYAWNGDTSNMTAVSTNGLGTLYKVSESVVDFDATVGEVSVTAVIGGVESTIAIDITEEMVAMWKETGAMAFGESSIFIFAVVDKDKMSANSELVELIPELNEMEVGVYFSEKVREIKSADYTFKPLDAKFLPAPILPVLMLTRTREGYSFNTDYSTFRNSVAQGAILVFNDALNKDFYHGGSVHFGENGVGVHFEAEGYPVAQVSFLSDGTITDNATA